MNKHIIWMIIGCAVPLLLIFLAPALGLSSNLSLLIFIIVMFGCHLLMPMHHGGHEEHRDKEGQHFSDEIKSTKDEH
jgi:hypothetical protein